MKRSFRLIRQALCVILALAVLCPCAQAAPARDLRKMEERVDESLRALVGLLGSASLLRDVRELREDEDPSGPFLEGVLLLGLSRGLLPRQDGDPSDGKETLSVSSAQEMLADLFTGYVSFPLSPTCPCIARDGDTMTVDYGDAEAETAGGARIFSVRWDGRNLVVLADVYATLALWQTDPLEVAEDCLTWEYTAEFVLAGSGSLFGYSLVSMRTFPEWEAGSLDTWQKAEEDGFSVTLPPQFSRLEGVQGAEAVYGTEDGACTFTVAREAGGSADPLSRARAEALARHPDAQVVMEPLLHYVSAETEGEYLVVFAPDAGGPVYSLRLCFPPGRQYEYSFYGEVIRNSFWTEGVPLG